MLLEPSARRDERFRDHIPGAGAEPVRLRDERTDGAKVDHIARHFVVHSGLDKTAHLHVLAAADHAVLLFAGNLFRESEAAQTLNAPSHVGVNQRAEILVLYRALALLEARDVSAKAHRK